MRRLDSTTRRERQGRVKRITTPVLSLAAIVIFGSFLRAFGFPTDAYRVWFAFACTFVLVGPVAYFVGTKIAEIR
mgnify:CR=1 FL=1